MTTHAAPLDLHAPANPSRGLFVVFEGGEGAGKSTQIRLLADDLTTQGSDVTLTREPGGSQIGREIRRILLDPDTGGIHPRTEALLFAADRAEHVATVIEPALAAGRDVISDRYMDSSAAYQGAGRGLSRDAIIKLSLWAADALVPDLTVVLDIDPVAGLARATKTEFGTADRIEAEKIDFAYAVRDGFLRLAAANPHRYLVVDATLPVEQIAAQVSAAVTNLRAA